jgi:phenylacetate-CoA ligase
MDTLTVMVEVSEKIFSDEIRKLENLGRTIRNQLESTLGISLAVKLVEPKTITRSEGKAKRIIDKRNI